MTLNLNVDFMDKAACRGKDPALFYPERGDMATLARAKAMCSSCPVRLDCLEFALSLSVGDDYGVWGGASKQERNRIRQRRRRIDTRAAS